MASGIEVVVVAYGAPELLEMCLGSLDGAFPVVVVDNSSNARVRDVVERFGAHYEDPGGNLGFAAGVNFGLDRRRTDGDVLLLNPDAAIRPDGIAALASCLARQPDLACVAPRQSEAGGAPSRVAWPFPSPSGAWLEAVGLGWTRRRRDFVIGSVLLIRSRAIAEVGRFDEQFFLYSEETDWQRRALDRGWRSALCPEVGATHVGSGTGGDPAVRDTHFHASLERYVRKHFGATGWQVFRLGVIAGAVPRAVVLPGDRSRRAALRLRLYLAGPCRAEADLTPASRMQPIDDQV